MRIAKCDFCGNEVSQGNLHGIAITIGKQSVTGTTWSDKKSGSKDACTKCLKSLDTLKISDFTLK